MPQNNHLLRALQIGTGTLLVAAIAIFGFSLWNDTESANAPASQTAAKTKVKRKRLAQNIQTQTLIEEGDRAAYIGNFETALQAYQQASEQAPKEMLPYEKIGDIYLFQKNYEAARKNFELAKNMQPGNEAIAVKLARSFLGLRKIIDAKTVLYAFPAPTQPIFFYRGLMAAFLNNQPEAKELLGRSMQLGGDEFMKANASRILTVYLEFEVARDGKIEHLQTLLAHAFDQSGEYGLAIELCMNALKSISDYRDLWLVLGHAYLNEEKYFEAEESFSKVIALDRGHPAGFFFRGIARQRLKKWNDAAGDFEEAITLGWKPKILAKQELANAYFELKNFSRAFPLYREVAATDPTDIERFVRPMALAINHLGLRAEAIALAEQAAAAHPDTAQASNLLGWAALANDDLDAAEDHLEEAIERDPELAAAYLNLGQLEEKEGDPEDAIEFYAKAAALAEKYGNTTIGSTAAERYNTLNTPQAEFKTVPSLSLQ